MIRNALAIALILVAFAGPASPPALAQTRVADRPGLGDKVRLRARHGEGRWWAGTVSALSADTLWMERRNSTNTLAFPITAIGDLEVSRGKKSNFLPGLAYGGLSGAVFFGAVGFFSGDDPAGSFIRLKAEEKALIGAAFGAGLGIIVGGVIGAFSHRDRWEAVQLDRVDVDVSARYDGGVTLSLAYGF